MKYKKIGNAVIHYTKNFVHTVVFIENGVETAMITRAFAMHGGEMFGIQCSVNGMGPDNRKIAYWVCQKLPCAKTFNTGSSFHDILYALGIALTSRKTADFVWFWINSIEGIPKEPWYKRIYLPGLNRAGVQLLRWRGGSSWNGGC